jgi:hypothetical protein
MFQNCSSTDNMFKKLYLNRTIGHVSRPLLVETLKDISPNIYGSGFPTSLVKYYSPPWIFASNWTHAHDLMSNLLQKPNLIFETRKRVLNWWKERVKGVRDRVDIALYDS